MALPEGYEPVTFLNSQGETITNDPVLLAQQRIDSITGVDSTKRDDSNDEVEQDDNPISSMSGGELKEYAKANGIDIKGLKTVGEVRERITTVQAAAEEAADEDSDDDSDSE